MSDLTREQGPETERAATKLRWQIRFMRNAVEDGEILRTEDVQGLLDVADEAVYICDEVGAPELSLGEAWRDTQQLISLLRQQMGYAANERDRLRADLRDEIEGLRVAAHEYEESGDSAMAAYERRQADRLEWILNNGGDHGDE